MGVVNFGIPLEDARYLSDQMGLRVAVEGGTFLGGTAALLSEVFSTVYTIEKSEKMFSRASQKLAQIANVTQLKGDTRSNLPVILNKEDDILFWLDAHWSGGETYGELDECPLLEELALIFESKVTNYVILIDDARLFMAPPPRPHDPAAWPSLKDIALAVPQDWDMLVHNDVIFLAPENARFRSYMQHRVMTDLKEGARFSNTNLAALPRRIARALKVTS